MECLDVKTVTCWSDEFVLSLHVQIENFEGPFSLLLYLIQREEMDIFDIPIHRMTEEYLKSLQMMKNLDLDIAGEFISMAATLIQIKSIMLLPQEERQEEEQEEELEDPRSELVHLLLEYKKYKIISEDLYQRDLLGRDVWSVGGKKFKERDLDQKEEEPLSLNEDSLFVLVSFYKSLEFKKKNSLHHISTNLPSVTSHILEMKKDFIVGKMIHLRSLTFQRPKKQKNVSLLMTFLSVLELVRMGFVSILQNQNFGDIYIETKKTIEEKALKDISFDKVASETVKIV